MVLIVGQVIALFLVKGARNAVVAKEEPKVAGASAQSCTTNSTSSLGL